jgi:hypothetical protein
MYHLELTQKSQELKVIDIGVAVQIKDELLCQVPETNSYWKLIEHI